TIANLTGFSWIIAGIISIIGIWLISKTETKDGKKVHPHWKLGLFLIISGILFGVFAQLISRWIILSGVVATFYNLRWIVSLGFGIFGLILLFSKNYKVLGIFLMVLGIAFWFLIPFVTSEIAQKYGLKGQIAVEESGFIPRLKRFWFYVQNPEQYFARYGEFTNPNAQQKGPPKGLKFISFEPVVSTFRTDQSVRLLAEIKNYAIPSFKENIGSEKTEGDGTNIEKGGRESVVTIGFSCSAIAGNDTKKGKVQISSSCGNVNSDENKVENLPKNKDCSLFVYCDFEENTFKLGSGKNITTFRAILSANYENFITESVLRTYVIGLGRYNELLKNEQWELALLNELRNAASIPGLINNERKVISEYTGGPVELAVNILNPQPIYPESDRYFTLIVKSSPYAAEWEGNVKPGSLFLSVPSWFKGTDNCAFVGDVLKSDTTNALSKRLSLSTDLKAAYSVQDLKNCYNTETGGSIRGCTFICDFAVEDSKQDNIEEYTIKAFQTSNYFLNKSTTFDIIDLKKRPEIKKEDGTIPSKDIPSIEGGETKPQCSDDKDNDSDGKTDINDPGCYDSGDYDKDDNNEKNYLYACNDFFDNDGDGAKDEADKDCYENSDINGIYHPEYDNGEEEIVSP
ncbi:MAG TPA: hypothetical protein VJI69_03150, partial [Bacteroidia bacterium]|nr:hypothetical protein [Bacteroidia bacterium]